MTSLIKNITNFIIDFMNKDIHNIYDTYIVYFSGGKDSMACFLHLLDMGIPREKIELWHHDIDGDGEVFMDWECTPDYCRKFAEAFRVPIYFSYKEGGFLREMLRENEKTAPMHWETPTGTDSKGGTRGNMSTRRKFPQVSGDLKVRWCSAYLKIDVGATALRNQKRFNNSRTLTVSGERGEESKARSKYAMLEPDKSDNRDGTTKRHVDRARPIRDWTEKQVWEIIEKYKIKAHPAYYMGWGRVSCKFCIFGNKNQFASAYAISPEIGDKMIELENEFGYTMKRAEDLRTLIDSGDPYPSITEFMMFVATSKVYKLSIFTEHWELPEGAYGDSCGPT